MREIQYILRRRQSYKIELTHGRTDGEREKECMIETPSQRFHVCVERVICYRLIAVLGNASQDFILDLRIIWRCVFDENF